MQLASNDYALQQQYDGMGWGLLINGTVGSGKTTISVTLAERLNGHGVQAKHVLFDTERRKFAPGGRYDFVDDIVRRETYCNAAAHYEDRIKAGEVLIIDTGAKDDITREPLLEIPNIHYIFLVCPKLRRIVRETLRSLKGENKDMQRDTFMYLKAYTAKCLRRGSKYSLPDVTVPFAPPSREPNLVVETHNKTIDEGVLQIIDYLSFKKLISV